MEYYIFTVVDKHDIIMNTGEGVPILGHPGRSDIMPVSKAQQRAVNKYVANNYDRVLVTMPKGQKDIIKG